MLTTASTVALILVVFGGLLTRLLHFSRGALGVAGGIILLIIAISMVLKSENPDMAHPAPAATDPMKLAVFPLAVPYLLNPAGIVLLVTISAETRSVGLAAIFIGLLVLVLLLDIVVFRWANRVSEHLDQSRMLITEKVRLSVSRARRSACTNRPRRCRGDPPDRSLRKRLHAARDRWWTLRTH